MNIPFSLTVFIIFFTLTHATEWQERPELAALFQETNATGTFVLYDVANGTLAGHNQTRAQTRYVPASTFKIPHSLIGLATGAVASVDDVLPYTGPQKPMIAAWAKDMGLREAIALSNVPIYQELARRIGPKQMREALRHMDYGNKETGERIDRFWLDGPLAISAVEQVRFLAWLATGALPFSKAHQASVREIVLLESAPHHKLYGKTGWQNAPGAGVGWWVGWVEKEGAVYTFALNLDIVTPADAAKRVALGRACLDAMGVTAP